MVISEPKQIARRDNAKIPCVPSLLAFPAFTSPACVVFQFHPPINTSVVSRQAKQWRLIHTRLAGRAKFANDGEMGKSRPILSRAYESSTPPKSEALHKSTCVFIGQLSCGSRFVFSDFGRALSFALMNLIGDYALTLPLTFWVYHIHHQGRVTAVVMWCHLKIL